MPSTLYAAGSNGRGQLGDGDTVDRDVFTPVELWPDGADLVAFAAGGNHALIIVDEQAREHDEAPARKRRKVLACGDDSRGQLSGSPSSEPVLRWRETHLPTQDSHQPHQLAATWDATFIAYRSQAHEADDILVSLGGSDFGERGVLDPPTDATSVVRFDAALPSTARHLRIAEIRAGPRHVVARLEYVTQDGGQGHALVGWGASRHGQLGPEARVQTHALPPHSLDDHTHFALSRACAVPTLISLPAPSTLRPARIAVGREHTAVLCVDEQDGSTAIYLLGSNKRGQLCGGKACTLIRPSDFGSPLGRSVGSIVDLASSWNTLFAVVSTPDQPARVFAWGSDTHGQLGSAEAQSQSLAGDYHPHPTPTALPSTVTRVVAGSEHALAVAPGPVLWAWGWNEHGNLGCGRGAGNDVRVPVRVPLVCDGATQVFAGCATTYVFVRIPDG